ncbi:MAG: S9 family peptidase [Vicinamibacteria bacterium]|nr:S9 family peptidase [Vicinamibacteria bacterium]
MKKHAAALLLSVVPCAFAGDRVMEAKDIPTIRAAQDAQVSPDGRLAAFVVSEVDAKDNVYQTDIWLVGTGGGEPFRFTRHPKNDRAPQFSPDGTKLAFISEREEKPQIFLADVRGGEPWKLSELKGGVSGFAWSPDGSWIAALSADAPSEDEEKRTKAKDDERVADQDFRMTHLHRIDVATRDTKRLTEGAFTLSDARISPDGAEIAAVRRPTPKADDGSASDIVIVPSTGGAPRLLFENSGADSSPRYSPDGRTIAFLTRDGKLPRTGSDSVAVIPRAGGAITRLTPIDLNPGTILWSSDGASILFTATVGVEGRLYSVPIRGGAPRTLMSGAFMVSSPMLATSAPSLVYLRQDPRSPNDVYIQGVDAGSSPLAAAAARRLTTLNPKLSDFALSVTEVVRWKAPDGREIEGLLHRPEGAMGKKLPLIVHVHGGPSGAYTLTFPAAMNNYHHILTGRGYAVLQPNFRGSTGYGDAFQRLNVNDWGKGDFQDIMSGVDSLIAKGVADPDRMALHGWSYGGYMCAWSITQTTRFKAASCGAALTNLYSMYGTNDIPSTLDDYFSGPPYAKAEVYWSASAMAWITKAKTPTLILHGQADDRVPTSQGQELYLGLKKLGVPTEFVTYPREPHGFREPNHQIDKIERELAWFAKWGVK